MLLAGCVPVSAGLWGVLGGMTVSAGMAGSHARYLSGLLLGIGLLFWWAVPTLERRGVLVRSLTFVVVIGGLARLAATVVTGFPLSVVLPLIMELGVTPALALWRERIERLAATETGRL